MALPQDGQNANGLTKVTEIPKGKELIFIDPTTNEGGIITLEDLATQILKNLTSQTFTLDQGNMTLLAALNQLNSKALSVYSYSNAWETKYEIDISNISTMLLLTFGGSGGKNSVALPIKKINTIFFNNATIGDTSIAISYASPILSLTSAETFIYVLLDLGNN